MDHLPSTEKICETEKSESPFEVHMRTRAQQRAAEEKLQLPTTLPPAFVLEKGTDQQIDGATSSIQAELGASSDVQSFLVNRVDALASLVTKLELKLDAADKDAREHEEQIAVMREQLARSEKAEKKATTLSVLARSGKEKATPTSTGERT